jgi:hypothetical protein
MIARIREIEFCPKANASGYRGAVKRLKGPACFILQLLRHHERVSSIHPAPLVAKGQAEDERSAFAGLAGDADRAAMLQDVARRVNPV